MQKLKNFLIGLLIFVVTAGILLYGTTLYVQYTAEPGNGLPVLGSKAEGEENTKYPVLTETTYFGQVTAPYIDEMEEYIIPALEMADSKYIWIDEDSVVEGVSKETLEARIQETIGDNYSDQAMPRFVDKYIQMVEGTTHLFTDGYNGGITYKGEYFAYKFGGAEKLITAFGNVFPIDECLSDEFHNDNPLKEKGLDLDVKNIEVEKLMFGPLYMQPEFNWFVAQVGADVKCQKKSEVFEALEWIPDKGETEHITFVYLCYARRGTNGVLGPYDIVAIPNK